MEIDTWHRPPSAEVNPRDPRSTATASRCVCNGEVTLKTRRGLDWTIKYPAIARAAGSLPDAIIDMRKICAPDENGAPDFAALQAAISEGKTDSLVYFAFDLLFEGGEDLRTRPLTDRASRLQQRLADADDNTRIRFVEHFEAGGEAVLRLVCLLSLEGIVSEAWRCALRVWTDEHVGEVEMPRVIRGRHRRLLHNRG